MYQKLFRALPNLHRGQRGMSGLETAIILIAFVTVASVLAYSVLSAGIFSAEKGKETVYSGLEQASSTLEVKGSLLGMSTDNTNLTSVEFNIGLVIPGEEVDKNAIVFNYLDSSQHDEGITPTSFALAGGSTERGASNMIESDEKFRVVLPMTYNLTATKWFYVEVIPPKGATLTLQRTLSGALKQVMELN